MSNETKPRILTIKGEANGTDKGALVCDGIMLVICLWNQIRYGMDMLFLIIPLALIAIFLVLFGIIPETYCFGEVSLEITHKFRKNVVIPYESVFNVDYSKRDTFINIAQRNAVKVYYTVEEKKRLTVCRPSDVETFVEMLKMSCCVFYEGNEEKSRLSVFFED